MSAHELRSTSPALLAAALCALLVAAPALSGHKPAKPLEERTPTVWIGPERLEPKDAGIGKLVPDLTMANLYGGELNLHGNLGSRGTVVVVRDPECPVSKRYGPRVADMARVYSKRGFNFLFIYLNEYLGPVALADDVYRLGAPGAYIGRGSFALAERLGVESTGDVFIIGADHKLLYRGAVDDQYGLGFTKEAPTRFYLRNAMDDIIKGRPVGIPATTAPGCFIDADPDKDKRFEALPDGVVS